MTAQQIIEAFPFNETPRYMIRDRDSTYGKWFRRRMKNMGIEEFVIAPRSPWQNPFVERVIGSIRRECLDHMIILGEQHLRRTVKRYSDYYNRARTHLSLEKDAPSGRPVQSPAHGAIRSRRHCGGLHHEYYRQAA